MRFSSYNIVTDRLPGNGYVLIHGLTGAMDLISEEFYELVTRQGSAAFTQEEAEGLSADVVEDYLERGFLTEETVQEESEYARQFLLRLQEEERQRSVVIIPNLNCNYRCIYCFERGSDHFKSNRDFLMTKEQVDAVFHYIEENDCSKDISLFGGEPLAKGNLAIIDYIVSQKNRKQEYTFRAVTNGHDLEHFIPYLGEGKIQNLQITVDGPKRIHDRRRIPLSRESSFDKIMENVLVGLGVSSAVADKLIGLEGQNKWCIIDASCDNCVHDVAKPDISITAVKELLDAGKLKTTDLNAAVLEKIRK